MESKMEIFVQQSIYIPVAYIDCGLDMDELKYMSEDDPLSLEHIKRNLSFDERQKEYYLRINIKTGEVIDNVGSEPINLNLYLKPRDGFWCRFLDENKNVMGTYCDYVPECFPDDHYGDYLILDIQDNIIINWGKKAGSYQVNRDERNNLRVERMKKNLVIDETWGAVPGKNIDGRAVFNSLFPFKYYREK